MGLFVPLDVDYQDDPKIIAAGYLGECLFNRSLALSKRLMSDGKIDRTHIARLWLGMPGRPTKTIAQLVAVGLWAETRDGWIITAWLKRNPAADDINEKAARKKASALQANHQRWHVDTGKPSDTCPLCYPKSDPNGVRSGSVSESTETQSETEPESQPETSSGRTSQQQPESDPGDTAAAALEMFLDWRMTHGSPVESRAALRQHIIDTQANDVNDYLARHINATALDVAVEVHGMERPKPRLVTQTEEHEIDCDTCEGTGRIKSRVSNKLVQCPWCEGTGKRVETRSVEVAQ